MIMNIYIIDRYAKIGEGRYTIRIGNKITYTERMHPRDEAFLINIRVVFN